MKKTVSIEMAKNLAKKPGRIMLWLGLGRQGGDKPVPVGGYVEVVKSSMLTMMKTLPDTVFIEVNDEAEDGWLYLRDAKETK